MKVGIVSHNSLNNKNQNTINVKQAEEVNFTGLWGTLFKKKMKSNVIECIPQQVTIIKQPILEKLIPREKVLKLLSSDIGVYTNVNDEFRFVPSSEWNEKTAQIGKEVICRFHPSSSVLLLNGAHERFYETGASPMFIQDMLNHGISKATLLMDNEIHIIKLPTGEEDTAKLLERFNELQEPGATAGLIGWLEPSKKQAYALKYARVLLQDIPGASIEIRQSNAY